MAKYRIWIRADYNDTYGMLNLMRGIALAEAAVWEKLDEVHLLTSPPAEKVLNAHNLRGVSVEISEKSISVEEDLARLISLISPYVPTRIDSRSTRPLVYLCGSKYDVQFQKTLWKKGIETVVIQDWAQQSYADWCVLPSPYGGEVDIKTLNGYTHFLRGSHYAPLRFSTIKAILKQRHHPTYAHHFAIATENLDLAKWLPLIAESISQITPPTYVSEKWTPQLTLFASPFCPSDDELKQIAGDTVKVNIYNDRLHYEDGLRATDLLFASDGIILQEALALGTPLISLPSRSVNLDYMHDHLVRRQVSIPLPENNDMFIGKLAAELSRISFEPSYLRAQSRIGQYLCDGMGSLRIIRQTVFKKYRIPQNLARYFEPGDPEIKDLDLFPKGEEKCS